MMTPTAPINPNCASPSATERWADLLGRVEALRSGQRVPADRVVVLLPYAQLMEPARSAWSLARPSGFAPRFETTRNWAGGLAPFQPGATDLSGDMARDSLVAGQLLERVAGVLPDRSLRSTLVGRLVEAARQLAPVASAQHPGARAAWAEALRPAVAPPGQVLQWEGLVASLALTWAGLSAYATDVLWSDLARPGGVADLLVWVPGFQEDPLAQALLAHWGPRAARLPWTQAPAEAPASAGAQEALALHACDDAEDEAQRASACVIEQVRAGRRPVALVAQDRVLTRRIGAQLHGAGLAVRDETGWKLSTTHAAARLMSLLRAADRRARSDDVLDWLKQGPHARRADGLERLVRAHGLALWSSVLAHPQTSGQVPEGVGGLLARLQAPRSLPQWLAALAAALQEDGWWSACSTDTAGQRVMDVLRLQEGAADELAPLCDEGPGGRRWPLAAFVTWVRDALEAASFQPGHAGEADVVVLPMPQLLGREFAAIVAPGCDEISLPPSPEPPGQWSPAQRTLLGLPDRAALAQAAQAAWAHLLGQQRVHVLWRSRQQGEAVAASPWVQALQGGNMAGPGVDPRERRRLSVRPPDAPMPSAADLLPAALSASAYQDLRDCPYRFFALRQLRLQTADEIESEPDKRDLGNWLHAVLKAFHEGRVAALEEGLDDRARLDTLARDEARERGLATDAGESGAGFLPFMAAWPALREGYLAWLADFEAGGPRFERAELSLSRSVGPWRLIGQLDRVDRQGSPEGPIPLVIDYKTEPRQTTLDRVKQPLEDTQIAFYAALLGEDTVRGAYLSITDSRETGGKDAATRWVEQPDLLLAREHLLQGIAHDLERIAHGAALPALGEGRVCEFCAARGLCRKDFRT